MYIQDKVEEYADEVFDLLDNGAHIYFCGLKGMMPGAPPLPCAATEERCCLCAMPAPHLCAQGVAAMPCVPSKGIYAEGRR